MKRPGFLAASIAAASATTVVTATKASNQVDQSYHTKRFRLLRVRYSSNLLLLLLCRIMEYQVNTCRRRQIVARRNLHQGLTDCGL